MVRCSALVSVLLTGCADEPSAGAPAASSGRVSASGGTTSGVGSTGPRRGLGPRVIDLGASALSLTEGESVRVTATVEAGDVDIVGGELGDGDGTKVYGTFARGELERWNVELSWDDLHGPDAGTFVGPRDVVVTAIFVDAAGRRARAAMVLQLACAGLLGADCGGTCVDLESSPDHCGACDWACTTVTLRGEAPTGGCLQQRCEPVWTPCLAGEAFADCDAACADSGGVCAWEGCLGDTVRTYASLEACEVGDAGAAPDVVCEGPGSAWPSAAAVRCCCGPA